MARCADVLAKYFEKWSLLPGSNQASKPQLAVYVEALIDLGTEALEYGCAEATRMAERFPWPGHIRKAAAGYRAPEDRSEFLGARALDWSPELEKERIERKILFERALASGEIQQEPPKPEVPKKINYVRRGFKSIEEQKKELREKGYLQ